jgi:arsenate reductase
MSTIAPFKVLFIDTENSSRAIFGEFLLGKRGKGAFEAHSAGVNPCGEVNPHALRVLRECYRIDAASARSRPVTESLGSKPDFVITLSDHAKAAFPVWPARTVVSHWGSPDPSISPGSDLEVFECFRRVALQIQRRVDLSCSLPLADLDHDRRKRESRAIGEREKQTAKG